MMNVVAAMQLKDFIVGSGQLEAEPNLPAQRAAAQTQDWK
jgi:hypothetical protein